MAAFGILSQTIYVYRVTTNRKWLDLENDRFLPDAFRMRKADHEGDHSLSVVVAPDCPTLDQAAEWTGRTNVRGIARLSVGDIHDLHLGMDVVQDADHHAGIRGLPYAADDEQDLTVIQKANDYANALAGISRICRKED